MCFGSKKCLQQHCCLLKLWLGFTALGDKEEELPKHPQAARATGKRRGRSDTAQGESAAQVGAGHWVQVGWDEAGVPLGTRLSSVW